MIDHFHIERDSIPDCWNNFIQWAAGEAVLNEHPFMVDIGPLTMNPLDYESELENFGASVECIEPPQHHLGDEWWLHENRSYKITFDNAAQYTAFLLRFGA